MRAPAKTRRPVSAYTIEIGRTAGARDQLEIRQSQREQHARHQAQDGNDDLQVPQEKLNCLQLCSHLEGPGDVVFEHACKLGCEGIVSKRFGSKYRPGTGKCSDWIKVKNPAAPAVKREAEEDWGKRR